MVVRSTDVTHGVNEGRHEISRSINLRSLDLLSLNLVVQCEQHGSISAAASRCHLSVMGASERLRRIEETLGHRLFHRHRSGLEVTEAGKIATRAAAAVLTTVSIMVQEVRAAPSEDGRSAENAGRRGKRATTADKLPG